MAVGMGWLSSVDSALRDLRYSLTSRPASGDIVFVMIDDSAIRLAGSATAARGLYARAVDVLVAEGAQTIVLDGTLGEALDAPWDTTLVEALMRAQGKARTVATLSQGPEGEPVVEMPPDRIAALAPPVFIDTGLRQFTSETYTTRISHQGWLIESLATALTPERPVPETQFLIDFAIDLDTVPRVSLSDVLSGRFDPGLFEGRQVLVGFAYYSQQSSRSVPRYKMISTPSVQLLAAETVRQDRMLIRAGHMPVMPIIAGVWLLFAVFRPQMTLHAAIAGAVTYGGILEFTALVLQVHAGLLIDTAGIHLAQLGLVATAFWHELEARGQSLDSAARERDSMRGILMRVVADNFDGVVVVDQARTIRAASRLAEEVISPNLMGSSMDSVLPPVFRTALEKALDEGTIMDRVSEEIIACGERERLVEFVVTLSTVEAGEANSHSGGRVACLTFRDITERRAVEKQLTYLAQHDPLTGASSRVKFVEDAEKLLATLAGRARGASIFLVGLSRLKVVNDTLGHAYGDALLRQVVERLHQLGPVSVARLEGNAFAVLREGVLGAGEGRDYAERLIAEVARPYTLNGHHAIVGARVGMTDSDLSGCSADTMVSHAGLALSIASGQPGTGTLVFSKDMDARIKTKQDMEVALRAALDRGEFSVHYQPQVDLETGEIIGVEALARWAHPELGNVSPAEFIPAAEETGLIIELGRWILHAACREVAAWPKPVRLSVNVSPLQFEHGDVIGDVRSALAESGMAPERLYIEITENLIVSETSPVIDMLRTLRAEGVRIALDDFGTGYSSLSYLGRLPVDTIKIDQSFVRGLPDDAEASAIVRAVLMISESLGKHVVAEGIETQDQAWLLRLGGCTVGQGYFFSRPGPAAEILTKLTLAEEDFFPAWNTADFCPKIGKV